MAADYTNYCMSMGDQIIAELDIDGDGYMDLSEMRTYFEEEGELDANDAYEGLHLEIMFNTYDPDND